MHTKNMEYKSSKVLMSASIVVGMDFNYTLNGTFSDKINHSISKNIFEDINISSTSLLVNENNGLLNSLFDYIKPSGVFKAAPPQVWEAELAGREIDTQKTLEDLLG